jgi:hypothetical protein
LPQRIGIREHWPPIGQSFAHDPKILSRMMKK